MSEVQKPRYRSPTVQVDAEVGLDEFSTEDLEEELAHRGGGEPGSSSDGFLLSGQNIDRISTLLLCGQRDSAIEYLGRLLESPLGRRL